MVIKDKTIAIVGGGPGGLTLARLLQMQGANVRVYERDANEQARVQGATLDLHEESGLRALQAAGLMDAFRASYRPDAGRVRIVDQDAVIVTDQHGDAGYNESRPEIDRGPLRDLLLASLKPGTVIWNSHFTGMAADGDGWKIAFQSGSFAAADIVIAADGANSKIRPYLTGIKPFYTGLTAIEAVVYDAEINTPRIHHLLKGGKIFAFGENKSLIVSSKGDGSLAFYAGRKISEHGYRDSGVDFADRAQARFCLESEFANWDSIWLELFERATSWMLRPQYCMPLDQTWDALPNLTMLGDAAHLMPPYAGEGANMAMLDALELSLALLRAEFADVRAAIAHYEKNMRERATAAMAMTLEAMEQLHSPAAIEYMTHIIGSGEVPEAR